MEHNHPRNQSEFAGKKQFGEKKTPAPKKPYMKFIPMRGNASFTQDDEALEKYIKGRTARTKVDKPAIEFETFGNKYKKQPIQTSVYFNPEGGRNQEKTSVQVWNPTEKQIESSPKLLVVGAKYKGFAALKNARLSK